MIGSQVRLDRCGTFFTEGLVGSVIANIVGVPLDHNLQFRMIGQHLTDLLESRSRFRANLVGAGVKEDAVCRHAPIRSQGIVHGLLAESDAQIGEHHRAVFVGMKVKEDLIGADEVGLGHVGYTLFVEVHLQVLAVAQEPRMDNAPESVLIDSGHGQFFGAGHQPGADIGDIVVHVRLIGL